MIKPLLEKFLSSGEVEVLRIDKTDFALKKITSLQAEYLNNYYEHFMNYPEDFLPFLNAIVIDSDKERLKKFLNEDETKLRAMINAICIQSLSLRAISLDYTLSKSIESTLEYPSIINRFISVLLKYGYKKAEIEEYSNNKIIRLAIEELYLRSKTDCLLFLAEFITMVNKEVFPLSHKQLELVEKRANELVFPNPEQKMTFLKDFNAILNSNSDVKHQNNQNVKTKSIEEIRNEIAQRGSGRKGFGELPK